MFSKPARDGSSASLTFPINFCAKNQHSVWAGKCILLLESVVGMV